MDQGQLINIQVESIDRRPSLNASTPIYAVVTVGEDLVPIVNHFKKIATQSIFDSVRLILTAEGAHESHLSLPQVLSALNWHYSEFSSYVLVHCFDTGSLAKLEPCPLEIDANGTDLLLKGRVAQSATLLIRLANEGKNKFHINSKNETKNFLIDFYLTLI